MADESKAAVIGAADKKIKLKKPLFDKFLTFRILSKAILILVGYLVAYLQWSMLLLVIALISLLWLESQDESKRNRIRQKAAATSSTKEDLRSKIDDIPGWVMFPDRERAEWLNQIIAQLWPTLQNYVAKVFRGPIQTKIRKKQESFRFEEIDFGCNPPKIDGVKVYNCSRTKDSIIIDFDVFYDGNCDINFSVSGAQIGGIRDFQLSVEMRIVLKPLLAKMPLVGGIQVFFLNTPDINFSLDGLSGLPGLSKVIRTKIEERLTKFIVFPNKVTKRFSKSVEASELKALEPAGVLRVHVSEAKELVAKDFGGKSDPYAVVYVGAQEFKTQIINQNLDPKWDYWCEFVILDPMGQHMGFKVYDHDKANEDDFLGSGDVDISTVVKGQTDQWVKLHNVKTGKIHLRFTWLSLSSNYDALEAAVEETKLLKVSKISTAILIVYVDCAHNLTMPKEFKKPHPFFTAMVSGVTQKSRVKKHTADPTWEQGFVFLVRNPETDTLNINFEDKETGQHLDQFSYNIKDLTQEENLEISKNEFELSADNAKLIMSLQLKILTNELFEFDDESESDSEDGSSRRNSITSIKSTSSTTTDSPARSPSVRSKIVEEKIERSSFSQVAAPPHSVIKKSLSTISQGVHRLGRLEMTLAYNCMRQKLVITIHRLTNLPLKDPSDIPDPYVKVKLTSAGNSVKHKTKSKVDDCDPVFEDTFEYLLDKADVHDQHLLVTVKTVKKIFFNKNTIGLVSINLHDLDLNEPVRAWYDLCPDQD